LLYFTIPATVGGRRSPFGAAEAAWWIFLPVRGIKLSPSEIGEARSSMQKKPSMQAVYQPFIWLLLIFALIAPGNMPTAEPGRLSDSFSTPGADHRLPPAQENHFRDFLSFLPFAPPPRLLLPVPFPATVALQPQDAPILSPALILPAAFLPRPPPLS
jgi:hypothetical protein